MALIQDQDFEKNHVYIKQFTLRFKLMEEKYSYCKTSDKEF